MALAAVLLLAPTAKAQGIHFDPTSGFTFDKYVKDKNPNADGEYTLHIETFATGEVTVKKVAKPSDVVLVLDASGSMGSQMLHPTYKVRQGNTANLTYSGTTGGDTTGVTCTFVRYPDNANGKLYPIVHGAQDTNGGTTNNDFWLWFKTDDGQTKYIYGDWNAANPDAWIHDERPSVGQYPRQNSVIAKGPFYKYPTRQQAIKYAVGRFIDSIRQNDIEDVQPYLESGQVGNQISIVQFTGTNSPSQITGEYPDYVAEDKTNSAGKLSKTLIGFTPVSVQGDLESLTNVNALKTAANSLSASGNTPQDTGLKIAQLLIQNLDQTLPAFVGSAQKRLRTVVFFTDGAPDCGKVRTANTIKKSSIEFAYDMKMNYGVKLFSIGFNPGGNATFLKYVSSNYPDAATTNGSSYSGTEVPWTTPGANPRFANDTPHYYMDAGSADMTAIFEAIADDIGGGSTSDHDNTPLLSVDMVSNSFQLPANADASRVKVWTAQCLGTTGETFEDEKGKVHDVLAFADSIEVNATTGGRAPVSIWLQVPELDEQGNPVIDEYNKPKKVWEKKTIDIDADITVNVDKSTNTVTVGGFEYEDLWCGLDPKHENEEQYDNADYPDTYVQGYRGFKIIMEFPIVVKDGATGGPAVPTNLSSSGVYTTNDDGSLGDPIIEYPLPDLPIPINLVIEKHGLRPGESASFTILKKEVNPADPNDNPYVPYNRVTLKGTEDGTPAVERLLNLDPTYYYKIWEEGWSWSYSNQAQDLDNAPTTETVKDNKFVIKNTYDDPDIKHAEASKRNVMEKTTSSTTTP